MPAVKDMKTIDVIIPTYKPDCNLSSLIERLNKQTKAVNKIILINTDESQFGNPRLSDNVELHHIQKAEFDHGGSRRMGVELSKADIFVMLTQDAEPENEFLIEELTKPLLAETESRVAVSYGRQLPRPDCNEAEKYTRGFNYPDDDRIKTIDDLPEMGIKTFFCSNVCAAYRRDIYDRQGGFVEKTIFNEDMIYAGKLIKSGYAIAYQAKARVIHSHNYNWLQYFHRNVDLGVSQAEHPEIFEGIKSEGEGVKLVKKTARFLKESGKAGQIPSLIWNSGWKYLGYLIGKNYRMLPHFFVVAACDNKGYWKR